MLNKLKSLKWPGSKASDTEKKVKTGKSADASRTSTKSDAGAAAATSSNTTDRSSANARDALNNPSEKIRLAAISSLDDAELLLSTALQDQSEAVRSKATRQYVKQLSSGEQTLKLIDTYCSDSNKSHLAQAIAAHHQDAAIRDHASSRFSEDKDLLAITLDTRFHDTRLAVANRLTTPDTIDRCWRNLKSKDKVVARALKVRLDEQRDAEKQQQQQTDATRKIIDEMERLATGAWSPNFITRFELFDRQWQQLDFTPKQSETESFNSFRQSAAKKVAANKDRQQKHDDCSAIIDEITQQQLALKSTTLEELPGIFKLADRSFAQCKQKWQSTDKNFDNSKDVEATYEKLSRSLKVQLQQAKTVLNAVRVLEPNTDNADENHINKESDTDSSPQRPEDKKPKENQTDASLDQSIKKLTTLNELFRQSGDTTPSYASELPQLLARFKKEANDRRESRAATEKAISRQFASLNSALASKRWGPARSIHERLAKKIDRLPAKNQASYQEKLTRLEVKLNELGDWKQFATEPKLVSLCEQMEKLPEQGLAPKDQADRIKALQQQWKSMGASPALDTYWPRFSTAADTAYEPCAKYFAARRDERDSKIKHREQVCEMLENYLEKSDWENPDWRLVEKTVRTAKAEWRNTRVFDRKATAELEQRFTRIVESLNEKLEPAYEAGVAEKTDLTEKVKALAEGDINQHCINQVKRLQGLWRRSGITRHKDDKKLWAEFNQACSDIFSRHRSQQKEVYAASIEHVTRGKQIIGQLKQLAKSETLTDDKESLKLQDEFQSLAEFPEKEKKYLLRDFGRAVDAVEAQIQKFGENSRSAELTRLIHNADLCTKLEQLAGQPSETAVAESERLLLDWDAGEKSDNSDWKKAIHFRRDSILSHLQAGTLPDFEKNTLDRRILCIEAEILTDKDTPASDKDLRMQHQLDRLQSGERGNINHSVAEEATNLKIRWMTSFPATPAISDALEQRFSSALGH